MKCSICQQDKKHFVVVKITKKGPEMACLKCYNSMKQKGEIK